MQADYAAKRSRRKKPLWKRLLVAAAIGLLYLPWAAFLLIVAFNWVHDTVLDAVRSGTGGQFIVAGVLAVIGTGLYVLRRLMRRTYAFVEMAFAIATTQVSLTKLAQAEDTTVWMSLAAAAYLFVRALDNLAEGQKTAEKKAEERKLKAKEEAKEAKAAADREARMPPAPPILPPAKEFKPATGLLKAKRRKPLAERPPVPPEEPPPE